MKAGATTAVLTSAGVLYGIYHGQKSGSTILQTAGYALLFGVAGAAVGSIYETFADTTPASVATSTPMVNAPTITASTAATPAAFTGGHDPLKVTQAKASANGQLFGFADNTEGRTPNGAFHDSKTGATPVYKGGSAALRKSGM